MNNKPCPNQFAKLGNEIFTNIDPSAFHKFLGFCASSPQEVVNQAIFTLQKPYGLNHILILNNSYGISFAQIKLKQGTSYHYHTQRKELFYVYSGQLTLLKENETVVLDPYTIASSNPYEKHALRNEGPSELLEVLEIFSPPLLDDKTRVIDLYNRKLGNVTHLE